jgi:hypothetical protein
MAHPQARKGTADAGLFVFGWPTPTKPLNAASSHANEHPQRTARRTSATAPAGAGEID